jgi:hypothetical protein
MGKRGTDRLVRACAGALAVVLSFAAPGFAQSPDGSATLTFAEGRVDVLRDGTAWALETGDVVKPRQVVTTGPDGYAQFRLADGSTFEVFPNSRVTFRANLGDWTDLIDVWIGKVKVQIQKLGGKPNHNRVRTPTALISVRGTVFHVDVEDEGGTTLVAVEEGLVEVGHLLLGGRSIPLTAGESVRVYRTQPLAVRLIDRGSMAKTVARSAAQALAEILYRRQVGGGSPGGGGGVPVPGGGGGVGLPGDERAPDAGAPPPPPPPPPPTP